MSLGFGMTRERIETLSPESEANTIPIMSIGRLQYVYPYDTK